MMMWVVLLCFLGFAYGQGPQEARLINDLLSTYNTAVRPVINNGTVTNVTIGLSLQKLLSLDERNGLLQVSVFEIMTWRDEFLVWDPTAYGGVSQLHMPVENLWRPDIALFNVHPGGDMNTGLMRTELAILSADGSVMWIPHTTRQVHCSIDVKQFPFDSQECILNFGSWTYHGSHITMLSGSADLSANRAHHSWAITSFTSMAQATKYECCPETYHNVMFTLKLTRHSFFAYSIYAAPALLVLLLIPFVHGFAHSNFLELTNSVLCLPIVVLFLLAGETLPSFDSEENTPILVELYLTCLKTIFTSTILMAVNKVLTGSGMVEMCSRRLSASRGVHTAVSWIACITCVSALDQTTYEDGQGMAMVNATDDPVDEKDRILTALTEAHREKLGKEMWTKTHLIIKRLFAVGLLIYCAIVAGSFPSPKAVTES